MLSITDPRRHLTLEQIVATMTPSELDDFIARERRFDAKVEKAKCKAEQDHLNQSTKMEETLLEKLERGVFGKMTKVELGQAHSEIDHWSKGLS